METERLTSIIASPDYRDGLVVILSKGFDGATVDLVEFYYENRKLRIEIFLNYDDSFSVDLGEFKIAFAEAEDKIRNQIKPY